MKRLGLIGYPLSHSFSRQYFRDKFQKEGIKDWAYDLYPLEDIRRLPGLISSLPALCGLNVTIPHKIAVLDYMDELDPAAAAIGAVNTILITGSHLKGYNTDAWGFDESLKPLLRKEDKRALILGNGGATKAVKYVLERLGIICAVVSRQENKGMMYDDIDREIMETHSLIINTTPLGMFPETGKAPLIPYQYLDDNHLLYDLIYNPAETLFLKYGRGTGSRVKNGLEMLHLQAEKAWSIWTNHQPV
jgi:shikimate dehydrogenase